MHEMIAAHKIPLFNFVLRRWLAAVLRRRFHNIYLLGTECLRNLDLSRPVVGCVNHTNWWDGFVLYVFSRCLLPHDIYLAMEEKNLRRYRFFTWMGVFGVDLSGPHAALPGLRYAVRLLRTTRATPRLVWLFVQGRLYGPQQPIEVKSGAGFLAKQTGAQILPLVLRYEWLAESRPSVFVQIGLPMSPETTTDELADVLGRLFGQVETMLEPAKVRDCKTLFPERMSMNKRWDYLVHLLLRRRELFNRQND